MLIGKRLKELRLAKGLNQKELGELVNVTKVSICCYENEKRTPNLETFKDLIKVFNVSADYLLGNDMQVKVVKEKEEPYLTTIAKEDLDILNEIKANHDLYCKLTEDPKRMVELINKKLRDNLKR